MPVVDSFAYAISSDQEWYAVVADLDAEWEEAVSRMRDIHQKVLAVKPLQWEYENERRLLVSTDLDNKEPKFLRFPASAIKEVILGELMESNFKEKVISINRSKYPNTLIKTARRADDDSLIID
ncbi:hypothetical protein [Vibrio sp. EJY3]|uniref:hypothetical protein n=1 Tax=Vibrio sp. (strain EJY3) TaxID=1116375 RepID=UPI000243BA26|nr:hypothetical protein [Vibrio sp. EJY3]AEX21544.1 hypothetical protein VEJY3_05240 [Vibrio sp. EJY3]